MIAHTKAFKVLKEEAQRVFDFAIVVTYAVPALKYALKDIAPSEPIPYKPDHFDARPVATEKVKSDAKEYKKWLSRVIFLSAFSFFEAYFYDVIKEILEFHGGIQLLEKVSISHNSEICDESCITYKRKLQEYPNSKDIDKYRKYGKRLSKVGYRFPSTLLSRYGLIKLFELFEKDINIRAYDIPKLAVEVLQLDMDKKTEIDVFHKYREIRNKIAHGRANSAALHISKAVDANNFLRNLALKIDRHIVQNFLVVEDF